MNHFFRNRFNNTLKWNIFGFVMIAVGILLGLYVGGWVLFVGGIVQVIEAIKATPVEALGIAVGILRVVVAMAVGTLIAAAAGVFFGARFIR